MTIEGRNTWPTSPIDKETLIQRVAEKGDKKLLGALIKGVIIRKSF
jgi:hypothetical protein